jgi:hypothetical protein
MCNLPLIFLHLRFSHTLAARTTCLTCYVSVFSYTLVQGSYIAYYCRDNATLNHFRLEMLALPTVRYRRKVIRSKLDIVGKFHSYKILFHCLQGYNTYSIYTLSLHVHTFRAKSCAQVNLKNNVLHLSLPPFLPPFIT